MSSQAIDREQTPGTCVGCGAAACVFFGPKQGHVYLRCRECGTLQLDPIPDAAAMQAAYAGDYAASGHCQAAPEVRNRAAQPQFQGILDALHAHLDGPSEAWRVLDYGPGWGGLLAALRAEGVAAEGAELSEAMIAHCRAQGFPVHACDLSDLEGEARYDAILMSSVFEHLTDHAAWLHAAQRLLKPGGLVVSLQPTAHFATLLATLTHLGSRRRELPTLHQVFWPPWHTVLFSRQGMTALVERHGFAGEAIYPAPIQREGGFTGLLQRGLAATNHLAHPLFGNAWPLWVGHVFVLRKS